jgi:hypothetical protein
MSSYKREDRGRAVGSIAVASMTDCAAIGKRPGGSAGLLSRESPRRQEQQSNDRFCQFMLLT